MSTRGDQVEQTLSAIRLLSSGRWLVDDLAKQLGCGRRTAYRILDVLGRAGVEIQREPEGPRVYLSVRKRQAVEALGLR